jgi:hypothetical protein
MPARPSLLWSLIVPFLLVGFSLALAAKIPSRPMIADALPIPGGRPGAASAVKASGDTLYVFGGPDRGDGKFQVDGNRLIPDDEGWTPLGQFDDGSPPYWHVDTFNAELLDGSVPGNRAMWCGRYFPSCPGEPENPGYGNNVKASIVWSQVVSDTTLATQVTLTARLNHDTEPGYDYLYLEVWQAGDWAMIRSWNGANKSGGVFVPVDVSESFTVQPVDYTGEQGDEIHLRWRFRSDGAFSDEDCLWPTNGAAQVDNIAVMFDQGSGPVQSTYDDFEPGSTANWVFDNPLCSLAKVWPQLADVGVCGTNVTPQLAFIDDGSACFSDGSYGTDWTYGPGGHVVFCPPNYDPHTDAAWSPVIDLPPDVADYDGAHLQFDAYVHGTADGTLTLAWYIRTLSQGSTFWSAWKNLGFLYEQHGPEYRRYTFDVTQFIPGNADRAQISLGVYKFSSFTNCSFVTPAPFYDNVALKLFRRSGPEVYLPDNNLHRLFLSGFPAGGSIDPGDPGSHSVRLDASNDTDCMSCWVAAQRDGAVLNSPPELHWKLRANPAYNAFRVSPPPNPVLGDSIAGPATGDGRRGIRYVFDLPDTGFFFPGDVLHYYIKAQDNAGGDIGVAILPGDTTGFSVFPDLPGIIPGLYPQEFAVRALPSLDDPTTGDQPRMLFWLRNSGDAELDEWLTAWANLGYRQGVDFDFFKTLAFVSLGATAEQLAGYDVLIYASGKNKDFHSLTFDDDTVLWNWLAQGGKKALFCGDNFVSRLYPYFVHWYHTVLGIDGYGTYPYTNVRPFIGGQAAPTVLPVTDNPVGLSVEFMADGSCYFNLFDAFVPFGTAQPILQWAAPDGSPGGYAPVAGIYNYNSDWDAKVVTLPFDLTFVQSPPGYTGGPIATRTQLLAEILGFFGQSPSGASTGVLPSAGGFSVRGYPNPFNPSLQIEYDMPRAGDLSVRIFNLRGELVRALLEDRVPAGPGRIVWYGTDGAGRAAAAGVYVYETQAFGQTVRRKVALIK